MEKFNQKASSFVLLAKYKLNYSGETKEVLQAYGVHHVWRCKDFVQNSNGNGWNSAGCSTHYRTALKCSE